MFIVIHIFIVQFMENKKLFHTANKKHKIKF